MLIEIRIRVEAKYVGFTLSLVDFRFEFKTNVNLSEAAFFKRQKVVSFD